MKANLGTLRAAAIALMLGALPQPTGAEAMDVETQVENGLLRGAMLLPAGSAGQPAVVIVPGSGPTDRDGNNPLGVAAAPYRMLAEALADKGIPSIRIDKRGMFASKGSLSDPNAVILGDYAADALAWIETATEKTDAGCAFLLGHSEGGLVALLTAQQAGPSLCGIILVAAPGRKMGDVLREQLRSNPANEPVLPDALAAIDALERGDEVDVSGFHPALQVLFSPAIQDFLADSFSHDPTALIADIAVPALIVQGGNDLQVGRADAENLSKAQPAAELVILPEMNHVLKSVRYDDMAANLAAYADPALPLVEGLAERITEFVRRER